MYIEDFRTAKAPQLKWYAECRFDSLLYYTDSLFVDGVFFFSAKWMCDFFAIGHVPYVYDDCFFSQQFPSLNFEFKYTEESENKNTNIIQCGICTPKLGMNGFGNT